MLPPWGFHHVVGGCGAELSVSPKATWSPAPTVRQYADICLFSTAQYKCPVAQLEQE